MHCWHMDLFTLCWSNGQIRATELITHLKKAAEVNSLYDSAEIKDSFSKFKSKVDHQIIPYLIWI